MLFSSPQKSKILSRFFSTSLKLPLLIEIRREVASSSIFFPRENVFSKINLLISSAKGSI